MVMRSFFFLFDGRRRGRRVEPLSHPRSLRFTSTASEITFLWAAPASWGRDGGNSAARRYQYQAYDDSAATWGRTATVVATTLSHRYTTIRASGHPQGRPIADGDEIRFRVRARNAKAEVSTWEEITGEARSSVPSDRVTWRGLPLFWRKEELTWR